MVVIGRLYSAELEAFKITFTLKGFISGMLYSTCIVLQCSPSLGLQRCLLHFTIKKMIHECGVMCEVGFGGMGGGSTCRHVHESLSIFFLSCCCRIPWFHYPIVYDIRSKPRKIISPTGSKGTCTYIYIYIV